MLLLPLPPSSIQLATNACWVELPGISGPPLFSIPNFQSQHSGLFSLSFPCFFCGPSHADIFVAPARSSVSKHKAHNVVPLVAPWSPRQSACSLSCPCNTRSLQSHVLPFLVPKVNAHGTPACLSFPTPPWISPASRLCTTQASVCEIAFALAQPPSKLGSLLTFLKTQVSLSLLQGAFPDRLLPS